MEVYLTYVLKSALLLSIFWGVYSLFLKRETFFNLNRWFLILGIITALFLPLVEFQRIVQVQIPNVLPSSNQIAAVGGIVLEKTNWWFYLFCVYVIGGLGFGIKFTMELFSLRRILRKGRLVKQVGKVKFIEVTQRTSPFSFFNTIVYNPSLHHQSELDTILKHETIHVSQKHSLDMIMVSVTKTLLWFNPISWIYKKELTQNLEYIADFESCVQTGTSEKDYQYLLLHQLSGISNSIINPFFNSLIKKRIFMLQKQRSHKRSSWKYALVLPFLAGFMLLFSFKTQVNYQPNNQEAKAASNLRINIQDTLPPLYIVNGKQQADDFNINSISTDDIESITVLKDESAIEQFGDKGKNGVIMIQLKESANLKVVPKHKIKITSVNSATEKPLVFVDDKQMPVDFNYNNVDPNKIKSIQIIKDKKATKKYGKDAKDGVIMIYLKDVKNQEDVK